MRVTVELQAAAALRMLNGTAERAVNMQPAAAQILGDLKRLSARQFTTAGAARGPAWAPLKQSTIKSKLSSSDARVRANAHRAEIATGGMRRDLTGQGGPSRATADEVIFKSRFPRAGFQHRGVPSRNLPARPLIRVDARDTKRHARIILAHLTQASDPVSRRTRVESA